MKEYRRVPLSMLRKRLKVEEYESETPYDAMDLRPASVRIRLKQHTGTAARPLVGRGQKVRRGQAVADVPDNELGAAIHASIDGSVMAVTDTEIQIHGE
jgi:Na+-translocating ferredoxin:NAD+ oxidoreductase RnfC subunit